MKKIVIRVFSLALAVVMTMMTMVACGPAKMEEFSGDLRERYDYNLNEYLKAGKYKELKIRVGADTISESELNAMILDKTILYTTTSGNEWVRVGEGVPAERGNIAEVKYQGYLDGEPMSDLNYLIHNKEEGYSMSLGAERLIPGIDEHIIGMKIGEKKTVEITVPDPCYNYPYYVGKTLTFELELAGLRAAELQPYGEGLFNENGCTTEDEFEAELISEIKMTRTNNLEDYVLARALTLIFEDFEVKKYPEKELEEIRTARVEADKAAAEDAGVTYEEYMKTELEMTADEYETALDEYAKQYVFEEMVLYYIARNEKIALTSAVFDEKATEFAEELGLYTPAQYMNYMVTYGYSEYGVREQIWFELVNEFIYENTTQVKE